MCRWKNQGVKVAASEPQSMEIEESQVSENSGMDLNGESEERERR